MYSSIPLIEAPGVTHRVGTLGQIGVTSVVSCVDQAPIGFGGVQPGVVPFQTTLFEIELEPSQSR